MFPFLSCTAVQAVGRIYGVAAALCGRGTQLCSEPGCVHGAQHGFAAHLLSLQRNQADFRHNHIPAHAPQPRHAPQCLWHAHCRAWCPLLQQGTGTRVDTIS